MRTTITLDDDVLLAARNMAERERKSLGEVVSSLLRQALRREASPGGDVPTARNGVPLLAAGPHTAPVTMALVNKLRDELE